MKVCWVAAVGWLLAPSGPVHWNRVALDPAPAFHFQSNVLNAILRVRLLLQWKRARPGLLSRSSVPGVHPVSKYALWTHGEEKGLIVAPVGGGRGVSLLLLRLHRGTLEQIVSALMDGVALLCPGVHLCFLPRRVSGSRPSVSTDTLPSNRLARTHPRFPPGAALHLPRRILYDQCQINLKENHFPTFLFLQTDALISCSLSDGLSFPFVRYGVLLSLTFS